MTWERSFVAAVSILVGWAALVVTLVGIKAAEDWTRGRAKRLAAQSLPPLAGSRLAGSKTAPARARTLDEGLTAPLDLTEGIG